jgi:hypothetical protein
MILLERRQTSQPPRFISKGPTEFHVQAQCVIDEATARNDALLDRLRSADRAIVPPLWAYGVTNTLLHLKYRRRITAEKVSRFLACGALPIEMDVEGGNRFSIAF